MIINAVRTSTNWYSTKDQAGRHVLYIYGNESTGICLCSVEDPTSDAPVRRILTDREENIDPEQIVGSGIGLKVYGTNKMNRPKLSEAMRIDPVAARAIIADCVRRGIGYSDPLIAKTVRKRLGLSQAEMGIYMDLSPENTDPKRRAANVSRTVRRYETSGAPEMYALALRWIAWKNRVLTDPDRRG